MALEGVPEHRLVGDALSTGVEGRRQLLKRFFPPTGNEPPAHQHKFGGTVLDRPHDFDRIGRGDIIMGL